MSLEFVEAELRDAFEHYRSRVIQLNRNNLAKLFEIVEVSPDSTEPEDLELVAVEEWDSLPDSINTLGDFYSSTSRRQTTATSCRDRRMLARPGTIRVATSEFA